MHEAIWAAFNDLIMSGAQMDECDSEADDDIEWADLPDLAPINQVFMQDLEPRRHEPKAQPCLPSPAPGPPSPEVDRTTVPIVATRNP